MSIQTFALLQEMSRVTAGNVQAALATMAQMDIPSLQILSTAYKINTSTVFWLWTCRIGSVSSLMLGAASLQQEPAASGVLLLMGLFFLSSWWDTSNTISEANFWHDKCLEFINLKTPPA